jgi:hypothetical protein
MSDPIPSGKSLPARPNLEQYKKQAKDLVRACHTGDPDASARVLRHHPKFGTAGSPETTPVTLTDAQFVLAREHGFESWVKFAAHIQTLRIEQSVAALADPVKAFITAASVPRGDWHASGTLEEAEAIRARSPHVAHANIFTAAVLGDDAAMHNFLANNPASATATGGPFDWDPLLYLCFSRYLRLDPSQSEGFTRTARLLLEAGANPNNGWYDEPLQPGGKPEWESALYGAAGLAHHPGITRLLLEYGADPNDGETPYHVPESYDNTVMQILLESGKLTGRSRSWMLARKADWHDYDGMKMALEFGADPNDIPHWGNSALQHSILRSNSIEMIRLLLDHGADPLLANQRDGRSGAAMAARRGRGDILRLFAERNIDVQLDGLDKLISACALADVPAVQTLIAAEPSLRDKLLAEGGPVLSEFAGIGNTGGIRCLLDLGVPVNALTTGDAYFEIAKDSSALHSAAWRGRPETVRLLLERGAQVNALDGKGRTALQLAVRACTDSHWKYRRSPEWIEPLLAAGASPDGIDLPTGYPEADELIRALGRHP